MRILLFLALSIPFLPITALAQSPSPGPSVAITASNQSSPTAQTIPSAIKPDPTMVKISTSGLELSGFPTWIIWILIGVAVIGVLMWLIGIKGKPKNPEWTFGIAAVLVGLALLALIFSIGNWWGRSAARKELQELIAIRGPLVEVPAPQTPPSPQTNTNSVSQAWPLHIVIMGFALSVGLVAAIYFYLYVSWKSADSREDQEYRIERLIERFERSSERLLERSWERSYWPRYEFTEWNDRLAKLEMKIDKLHL